ncbi:hypothetical protein B0H14DRAFT_3870854 [Mycena olivaceomarginata]|nr:hypothetical protein B0H14DRAFT_3870854 [Mycena olivaceomarginata]
MSEARIGELLGSQGAENRVASVIVRIASPQRSILKATAPITPRSETLGAWARFGTGALPLWLIPPLDFAGAGVETAGVDPAGGGPESGAKEDSEKGRRRRGGQKRTRAGWGARAVEGAPTTHVTLGSYATPYGHALLSLEKLSLAGKYVQKSAPPSYTNVGLSSKEALLVKGRRFVNGGALDLRATCYVRPRAVRGVVVPCAPTLRHPNGNLRQNLPPPSLRTIKSPPPQMQTKS